jgi:hypothetical protein
VRVAFALDCHDREVVGWVATTAGISGEIETEPPLLEWRPHARSRRNRVASDRLRFAFMYEKGGKGPGFRDSTGEYLDARTGWLRGQSRSTLRPTSSAASAGSRS